MLPLSYAGQVAKIGFLLAWHMLLEYSMHCIGLQNYRYMGPMSRIEL